MIDRLDQGHTFQDISQVRSITDIGLRPGERNDGFCWKIECGGVAPDAAVYLARLRLIADDENVASVGILKSHVIDAGQRPPGSEHVCAALNHF